CARTAPAVGGRVSGMGKSGRSDSRSPIPEPRSSERSLLPLPRSCRVDPEGGVADESDELIDLGDVTEVGGDPVEGEALGAALLGEDAERLAERGDRLGGDAGAAEPDHVQAGDAVVPLLEDERGDVLGRRAEPAEHRQPADPDALLHRRVPREDAPVVERDVPGDERPIDQGAAVADPAVVAEVAADHEQAAVADPGLAVALDGGAGD